MSKPADKACAPLVRLRRKLATAGRIDPRMRSLVIEAAWRLLLLRLCFLLLPFRLQRRFFGRAVKPDTGAAHNAANTLDDAQAKLARQIGWAIRTVEKNLPFEIVCLTKALVARRMLRKRGIDSVMVFGAGRNETTRDIATHAWLDAGPVKVSGYPIANRHDPFAVFIVD